jgi:mono/diheme cytochrome c family protein
MALRSAAVRGYPGLVRSTAAGRPTAGVHAWIHAWIRKTTVLLGCLGALACDRPPSAESLPEWTPQDHHSTDDDQLAAKRAGGARSAKADSAQSDVAQLVDLAWRQQCTTCHGPAGRGDGQMGPMLHAPDLTSEQWQDRVTDADMALVIKNGRNRMPSFDLPQPVLRGLVARVRSLRAK